MSQGDVQRVREIYAVWNERGIDAMIENWAEDGEWEWNNDPSSPAGVNFRGREAVESNLRDWADSLGPMRNEIRETRDAGDGVVVVIARVHAEGPQSGVDFDSPPMGQVVHLDGNRIRRIDIFFNPDDALRAAGLEP